MTNQHREIEGGSLDAARDVVDESEMKVCYAVRWREGTLDGPRRITLVMADDAQSALPAAEQIEPALRGARGRRFGRVEEIYPVEELQSIPEGAFRPWLFSLSREGAKREAKEPKIPGMPYWTVGPTSETPDARQQRLAEAVLLEDWKQAGRLWGELVREAVMENFRLLRRMYPAAEPLADITDSEEILLAHIRSEQPDLLRENVCPGGEQSHTVGRPGNGGC